MCCWTAAACKVIAALFKSPQLTLRPHRSAPPLPARAAVDDDAAYFTPDEDQVFTTPLRLLQAIDLYLARLQGRGDGAGGGGRAAAQLTGASMGLTLPQMQEALKELKEDVQAYWYSSDSEAC